MKGSNHLEEGILSADDGDDEYIQIILNRYTINELPYVLFYQPILTPRNQIKSNQIYVYAF